MNIAERLDLLADETPDKLAIIYAVGKKTWKVCSYGELRMRNEVIPRQLQSACCPLGYAPPF